MEIKVVLDTILRTVRLRPQRAEDESVTRRAVTFAPRKGGRILVEV